MLVAVLRTLIIYFTIIIAMRLMGKKQLGELQPSELVSTILISNLASIPIESPEIPVLSSILPVLLIVCLEILVSALCTRSRRLANLVSGRPKVVVRDGVIDQTTLKELRFTVDDLLAALRAKDIFELDEVSLALVETNGSVSVYKSLDATEVTRGDLHLPSAKPLKPSMPLVVDGALNDDAAEYCGVDRTWLEKTLRAERLGPADVLLMLCNDAREYTIVKKQ
ncbi:DUF421 domain-containing protein [Anaerofilum sp. BX8]|uniref:DUF421 domain-containing protein n=1 Tax=Anaerofilum hominis TaxID=2763016 RepID=A0A923IAN2_9FIRM|nr:DUF421 domain-containing protein [Anaerofilum hominis]MBC5582179.1 DUF421 domain-containing protein [Anaerofilum hominis]